MKVRAVWRYSEIIYDFEKYESFEEMHKMVIENIEEMHK